MTVISNVPEVIISPSDKFSKIVDVPTSLSVGVPVKVNSDKLSHDGPDEIVKFKSLFKLSISLTSKSKLYNSSSLTESTDEVINSGASLMGKTVKLNSSSVKSVPSLTVTLNVSSPLKFATGVKVTWFCITPTWTYCESPPHGTFALYCKYKFSEFPAYPSTSVAYNSKTKDSSSNIVWSPTKSKTGASFTGVTFNIKLPEPDAWPSLAITVTSISPL